MMRCLLVAAAFALGRGEDSGCHTDGKTPCLSEIWEAETIDPPKGDGHEFLMMNTINKDVKPNNITVHYWDYGPQCRKLEFKGDTHDPRTGTYLMKCDAVDCCIEDELPDPKEWQFLHAPVYRGEQNRIDNFNPVKNYTAQGWSFKERLPFVGFVNYTYWLTPFNKSVPLNIPTNVNLHEISYFMVPPDVPPGSISYQNF